MNAIDTNILAYALADGQDQRHEAARVFVRGVSGADTVLLWQVMVELGATLEKFRRTGRLKGDPADGVRLVRSRFAVVTPTERVADPAESLRTGHGVSYWDSLLLGACIEAGVTTLYSEDAQSRPEIDGVRIVNPLD